MDNIMFNQVLKLTKMYHAENWT